MRTAGPQARRPRPTISSGALIRRHVDDLAASLAEQPDIHAVRAENGDFRVGADRARVAAGGQRIAAFDNGAPFDGDRRAAATTAEAVRVRIAAQAIGRRKDILRQFDVIGRLLLHDIRIIRLRLGIRAATMCLRRRGRQ